MSAKVSEPGFEPWSPGFSWPLLPRRFIKQQWEWFTSVSENTEFLGCLSEAKSLFACRQMGMESLREPAVGRGQ